MEVQPGVTWLQPSIGLCCTQVLPDGTYQRLGTPQSNYLGMLVTRVQLLYKGFLPTLQKACTIAVRYAVIRHQSRLRPRQAAPKG